MKTAYTMQDGKELSEKEFIEYLIKSIVKNPDAVKISESQGEEGKVIYTITASKEDMGTIIGRKGRNIQSIRNVARIKAIRDDVHIQIEVVDEDGRRSPNEAPKGEVSDVDADVDALEAEIEAEDNA